MNLIARLAVGSALAVGIAGAANIAFTTNGNFTVVNGSACGTSCTVNIANTVNLGGGNVGDGGTETITINNVNGTSPIDGAPDTAAMTITEGGQTAYLVFEIPLDPQNVTVSNVPNGISYEFLRIQNSSGKTFTIPTFTLQVLATDSTNGGTVSFLGLGSLIGSPGSPGGVTGNATVGQTNDTIAWQAPLSQAANGHTTFTINSTTQLVAPSSLGGETTIQGTVVQTMPEPASILLIGSGLLAVGFISRKKLGRKQ